MSSRYTERVENRILVGLGSVLSAVLLILPLAQLACSSGYATLSHEFGNFLARTELGTTGTAAYALGAALGLYAPTYEPTTPDAGILDLTRDGPTVHTVALAVGTATLNYSDLSTTVDVVRVDTVAAPTGASLVRGALARLPLHYAAGTTEVFARNQVTASASTAGASTAGHTPLTGLDQA